MGTGATDPRAASGAGEAAAPAPENGSALRAPQQGGTAPGVHIGGQTRQGPTAMPLVNPSTGQVERVLGAAGQEEVQAAVACAQNAHQRRLWAGLPPPERQRILWEAAQLLRQQAGSLALDIARESGMPLGPARYAEVPMAADALAYFASTVTDPIGSVLPFFATGVPPTQWAFTLQEPRGVAALITPFNFPLLIPAWKVGACLAAGCPAVLKPAAQAPTAALRLAEALTAAGAPEGTVAVLAGDDALGAALVAHPAVRTISLTGQRATGQAVMAAAASGLKRLTLELGGKSAVIVCADADLEAAVEGCLFGIYFHAGQVCQAGSRILVEQPIYEAFVTRFAERAMQLQVGPAEDPATDLGPVISLQQWQYLRALVQDAVASGAQLAAGAADPVEPQGGFFYPATALLQPSVRSRVWTEEAFGPIACIRAVEDLDAALAEANATAYGLAAGIWTRDLRRALRAAEALEAGTVWINTTLLLSPSAPFGGYKESGMGRELGRQSVAAYREAKTVIIERAEQPWSYF